MGWGWEQGYWNKEDFLAPLKLYCKEKEFEERPEKGEIVLLLDMLLIWRSWQKAGRQRGRVSGALTRSQQPGSRCSSVAASGPATISLCLHVPSAHEGAKGKAPRPGSRQRCKSGILFKNTQPIWFPLSGLRFLKCRPPPPPLQSRFPPCDPIFSQWCSVLWLVVLCA